MQIGSLIKQIDTSNNGLHEINDEELQELHKVLTTMMRDIASFCEKNDISWCLSGGSILGAVRHGGISKNYIAYFRKRIVNMKLDDQVTRDIFSIILK